MIIINQPKLVKSKRGTRLQAEIEIDGNKESLWYEVEDRFQHYLTYERADAFLVALIPKAIKENHDILVNYWISCKLYYSLKKYLIPTLANINKAKNINIHCSKLDSETIKNKKAVGTGLSCGVDSFSTIYDHNEAECPHEYGITHLTFFNVGSHGSHGGEKANQLFNERKSIVERCAHELGKDLVIVDSNISELLKIPFPETHTLRSISAALTLQKLFNIYYYSSAVHIKDFKLNERSMGHFDIFSLPMLETENISFYSTCSTLSRIDKTKKIADYKIVQKYLNVCVKDGINCGKCFKCLRTLLTLDLLGKLDSYKSIFNMKNYFNERENYIAQVISNHKEDILMQELYKEMVHSDFKIPSRSKFYSHMKLVKRKLMSSLVKAKG
jgi:hypothetical protein